MEIKRTNLILILMAAVLLIIEPNLLNRYDHWPWWHWDDVGLPLLIVVLFVVFLVNNKRRKEKSHS